MDITTVPYNRTTMTACLAYLGVVDVLGLIHASALAVRLEHTDKHQDLGVGWGDS